MAHVTIYTRSWCGYCAAAKELLRSKDVEFEDIDIEAQPDQRKVMIDRAGGRTSVPQIFIGDVHVGGSDDLHALDRRGGLESLLAAA